MTNPVTVKAIAEALKRSKQEIEKILEEKIQKAPPTDLNIMEAEEWYGNCQTGTEEEEMSLIVWLSLCTSIEGVKELLDYYIQPRSSAEKFAIHKLAQIMGG